MYVLKSNYEFYFDNIFVWFDFGIEFVVIVSGDWFGIRVFFLGVVDDSFVSWFLDIVGEFFNDNLIIYIKFGNC